MSQPARKRLKLHVLAGPDRGRSLVFIFMNESASYYSYS